MKRWAWVWLACFALIGWIPALLVSSVVFLAVAFGFRLNGALAFDVAYYALLGVGLFLMMQVGNFFGLAGAERRWFTWAGGGCLVLVWVAAFWGLRWGWVGGLHS